MNPSSNDIGLCCSCGRWHRMARVWITESWRPADQQAGGVTLSMYSSRTEQNKTWSTIQNNRNQRSEVAAAREVSILFYH